MKEIMKRLIIIICFIIPLFSVVDILNTNERIYITGIKNKGIDYIIPTRLTHDTYEKLGLLMNQADREKFETCYKKEDEKYVLDKCNKKEIESIVKEASILNYMFYSALQNKSPNDETLGIKDAANIYNVLKGRNEKQRIQLLKTPKREVNKFSDKLKLDYAYKNIIVEESKFGLSQNTLRDNYINKEVIRMLIATLLLLTSLVIELVMIKNKDRKVLHNIILLILLEIYSLNHNLTINLVIIAITVIIMTLIYLFRNKLKRTKLEIKLEKKAKKINPTMLWIIVVILFTMINQIIYGLYTSYHIFVGVNAEKVVSYVNGFEVNTIIILLIGIILIKWKKKYTKVETNKKEIAEKKTTIKEEKQEDFSKKQSKKKKSKKKKKK